LKCDNVAPHYNATTWGVSLQNYTNLHSVTTSAVCFTALPLSPLARRHSAVCRAGTVPFRQRAQLHAVARLTPPVVFL